MTFSETLCKVRNIIPETNDLEGTCCMCGKHTNNGFKKKFKANFTTADYVSSGDAICPECYYLMMNSDEYRRTMFLLTEHEFKKFKKSEAKEVIFNLPDEPFYLYLTQTWQKVGWLRMDQVLNNGVRGDVKVLMDYQIVQFNLEQLKRLCDLIKSLRELKISKKTLEAVDFQIYEYRKIIKAFGETKAEEIINQLKNLKSDPVYNLSVYLEK